MAESLRQIVGLDLWDESTQSWEQSAPETVDAAVKREDGTTVKDALDAVPDAISAAVSDAITALKGGVGESGDNLKKLYDLIGAIQVLLESDDVDLDTVQEIVAYIKANKDALTLLGESKVNIADIVNDLETVIEGKVLDARQGKALKDLVDALQTAVTNLQTQTASLATKSELNAVDAKIGNVAAAAIPIVTDTPPANPVDKQQWWKPIGTVNY